MIPFPAADELPNLKIFGASPDRIQSVDLIEYRVSLLIENQTS